MPQTPEAAELQAITDKTLNEALEIILKVKREAVKSREKAIEAKEVALQLRETLINALEKLYVMKFNYVFLSLQKSLLKIYIYMFFFSETVLEEMVFLLLALDVCLLAFFILGYKLVGLY